MPIITIVQVCGEMITIAGKKTCAMDKPSNPDNLNMMDVSVTTNTDVYKPGQLNV